MAETETISRTERRKAQKQTKEQQRRMERQKKRRVASLRKAFLSLAGIALLGGIGYLAYGRWASGSPGEPAPSLGNRHIASSEIGLIQYNTDPPTSGPHLASIARWGIHEVPIPKELQVHNLEDGGVLVQYNCPQTEGGCRDLVEKLAGIATRYQHAILAPYPGMSHKIALTAWGRLDKFNEFDETRIARFIESYIDIDHHPPK